MRTSKASPRRLPADQISDGLLKQMIGALSHERGSGLVIALTSVDPRAGVGYLTRSLAQELGEDNAGSVLCIDSSILDQVQEDAEQLHPSLLTQLVPGKRPSPRFSAWPDGHNFRQAVFEKLRENYQYIFVACPCLAESSDVVSLASIVDGVIIVVEANRTQTRQIAVVEKMINAARGQILGLILNKREYFIPGWLFSKLSRFGI
jgi:Mrp family chromosome partitioning ATPase